MEIASRNKLVNDLQRSANEYSTLKDKFATFSEHARGLEAKNVILPGVSFDEQSDTSFIAQFLDCRVRFSFSYDRPKNKGVVTAEKIATSDEDTTLFDFRFNETGTATDIAPRHGAPMRISEPQDAEDIVLAAIDKALRKPPA